MATVKTIDNLDNSIYTQYAKRTQLIEQINKQMHLGEAGHIPPQTSILSLDPKLSQLDFLVGVAPFKPSWPHFTKPKNFDRQRRSSFAFHRVLPSLGSYEEQNQDAALIEAYVCQTGAEEAEKSTLLNFFQTVDQINGWVNFITGRKGQYLQG